MVKKIKFIFLFSIFLYGCGGGESSDSQSVAISEVTSVQALDTSVYVNANQAHFVDLSDTVVFSQAADFQLSSVALSAQSEGKPLCESAYIEPGERSFTIIGDGLGLCTWQYEITPAAAAISDESDLLGEVAVSFIGEQQMPFQADIGLPFIVKNIDEATRVSVDLKSDLGADYPQGFRLDGDVVILGSGSYSVDTDQSVISIFDLGEGKTTLYYQLISQSKTEIKFGSIIVAVSEDATAYHLVSDIEIEKVALQAHTIDVLNYLPEGESLEGLQLIDVKTFGDFTSLSGEFSADFANTKFILNADLPGNYRAVLEFTDHQGNYILSSAAINVINPFGDIVAGDLVFSAPFTVEQAEYAKLGYVDTYTENGSSGPALSFPLYQWHTADNVCSSLGAYLPSKDDLLGLFAQEGNVFNGTNKQNWPTSHAYWTSDTTQGVLQDSSYQAVRLDNGAVENISLNPEDGENKAYLTCIVLTPQSFDIQGSDLLSAGQTWTYTITFDTLSGQTYSYSKPVLWTSSDDTVLQINDQGIATALKQGKVTLTASGVSDEFIISFDVDVIALPDELKVEVLLEETTAGSQRQFYAVGYYENGDTYDFTDAVNWSVSKSNLARIYSQRDDNTSGLLKAFSAGNLTVSASLGTEPSTVQSDPQPFTIRSASSRNTCYPLRAGDLYYTCNLTEELASSEGVARDSFVRTGSEAYSTHMPVGRNETFYSLNQARNLCDNLAESGDYWLPDSTDLANLFDKYDGELDINHKLYTVYDWSTFDSYNTKSTDDTATPLIYNLASAVVEPNSDSAPAMTSCVTNKLLVTGIGNDGSGDDFAFNPIVGESQGVPANLMMRSVTNFGSEGTVPSNGFIFDEQSDWPQLIDRLKSKNPPRLIITAYNNQNGPTNDSDRDTIVEYLKRGGAMLYMNQDGNADELIEDIFELSRSTLSFGTVGAGGSVFQFADIDDPLLNGPFGDIRNEYWGVDSVRSGRIYSDSNFYPDDMIGYSLADDQSGNSSGSGFTMIRHAKYKFVWIGDSGFLGGERDTPDPTRDNRNPFAYTGDYVPAKNTNYGRDTRFDVSNSIFYANFLHWVLKGDE